MTLAEKIFDLRKKNGWSQEELAEKCAVSRQSVSKWESGQSVPDLSKIIILSDLFHVSTDYLLREELKEEPIAPGWQEKTEDVPWSQNEETQESQESRYISRSEAEEYLELTDQCAPKIALGVLLCIISPAALILLAALSEYRAFPVTEAMAAGIGVTTLLVLVAIAVFLFITNGMRLEKYQYLEQELLDLEDGLEQELRRQYEENRICFPRKIATGVILCILAAVPLMIAGALEASDLICCILTALLLVIVSIGVFILVQTGMEYGGFQRLLQEGDFTRYNKSASELENKIGGIYWPCIVAIYLAYSFITGNWQYSWIIWPVAGVAFAAIQGICRLVKSK